MKPSKNSSYDACYQFLEQVPVVSTHEHHLDDADQQNLTLAGIFEHSYVAWLGVPVGTSREEHAGSLEKVKYNSYYVWLEKALQKIYDFDGPITAEKWDDISRQIEKAHADDAFSDTQKAHTDDTSSKHKKSQADDATGQSDDEPFHLKILRGKCRYKSALTDIYWDPGSDLGHPAIFHPVFRSDSFISSFHPEARDHDDNTPWRFHPQIKGYSFDEYAQFVVDLHRKNIEAGSVAFKMAVAYERTLSVSPVDAALQKEAHEKAYGKAYERAYENLYQTAASIYMKDPAEVSMDERAAYGDYFIHRICSLAEELDVPIQIHTGLGRLRGSNPMLLEPLIEAYPNVKFVLFHGGYPWYHEIGALAHNHTNVYIDMVWLPIISTTAAVQALHEYIEIVPSSDRIAWGSDTWTSEEAYGALLAYRHVVARVISEKIEAGYLSFEAGKELMERLMYMNGETLYRLE